MYCCRVGGGTMSTEKVSPELRSVFDIHRTEAKKLFKEGKFTKALKSFDSALRLLPDNRECLVERSHCHLMIWDLESAIEDADESLRADRMFVKGLYCKAEAYYHTGNFEQALLFYHRGQKLRPDIKKFQLGINKSQDAISNALGEKSKLRLTLTGDLSGFGKEIPQKILGKRLPPDKPEEPKKPKPPVPSKKTIKELLGDIFEDREYLDFLLKKMDLKLRNGPEIKKVIENEIDFMDIHCEFWREEKPIFSRVFPKTLTLPVFLPLVSPDTYISNELSKIENAHFAGKYKDSIFRAKRCLQVVETYTEEELSKKMEICALLHYFIGLGYMEINLYNNALNHYKADWKIGEKLGNEDIISRGLNNVGTAYARSKHYQKAVDIWVQKIPLLKFSSQESAWLFHELGRCYLELQDFNNAKDYGEQSLVAAEEIEDTTWMLHALLLIAQAESKLGSLSVALEYLKRSLVLANKQGNESISDYLKDVIQQVRHKLEKKGRYM